MVDLIWRADAIFWDFDGVIKDSVDVKTAAFESLFLPYGSIVASRVRAHHESHGGVSRFDKIPLYLEWAGLPTTADQINVFCNRFSSLVLQGVVDSPWVPGVRDYLLQNYGRQYFFLITATPQVEIEWIVGELGIAHCFCEIHGAPMNKKNAIARVVERRAIERGKAVVIGDAETDLLAACANGITFFLRRTELNKLLQATYDGPQIEDLT